MKKKSLFKSFVSLLMSIILFLSFSNYVAYAYDAYVTDCESKISNTLLNKVKSDSINETLAVSIMYDPPENNIISNIEVPNKESTIDEIQSIIMQKRRLNAQYYSKINSEFVEGISDYTEVVYICKYAPMVVVAINSSEVSTLSRENEVVSICENDQEIEVQTNVSRSVVRANTIQDSPLFGYTGVGVKVGVLDGGFPDISHQCFADANIICDSSLTNMISDHATNVVGIMASNDTEAGEIGIAPGATYYSSYLTVDTEKDGDNYFYYVDFFERVDDLVECGVNVINMSFALPYENEKEISVDNYLTNTYSNYDSYVDYITEINKVVIVKSAGNRQHNGVSSPGMAYNAITVANLNDNNTVSVSDDSIYYDDQFKGSSYINATALSNIASKPDISAPGTNISAAGYIASGTSMAAPHVTGAVALMFEQEPLLMYFPAAVKAIMAAGVRSDKYNFVPSQRTQGLADEIIASYTQYGAGILNCTSNGYIITQEMYDMGVISATTNYATQLIQCTSGEKMRVALAFLHIPSTSDDTNSSPANLDLKIYSPSGTIVASSITTNNNVEIVEFIPTETGEYTARIVQTTGIGQSISIGIAWV